MATHGTATNTRANDHTHRERSIAGVCDAAGASTWARRASFVTMLGDSRATATATATAMRASSASTAPTVALTVGLTRTYQGINARYYEVGGRALRGSTRAFETREFDDDSVCRPFVRRLTLVFRVSGWSVDGVYRRRMRDMDEKGAR